MIHPGKSAFQERKAGMDHVSFHQFDSPLLQERGCMGELTA